MAQPLKYQLLFLKVLTILLILSLILSCTEEIYLNEQVEFNEFPEIQQGWIEDQYIVVLHESQLSFRLDDQDYESNHAAMRKESEDFLKSFKISPDLLDRVYSLALTGFTARVDNVTIESIKNDPRVKYVEQDRWVILGRPDERPPTKGEPDGGPDTQVVPYGIKRVGGPFHYAGRHSVFVIDTGIQLDHPDLNVDDKKGFDAYNKRKDWNLEDEHGHGTHVAGTIGALDNNFGVVGVAAGVPLVPVKVFYGPRANATYSGILAGIEHVGVRGIPGDVANLSFGSFDSSNALDEAVLRVSEKRRIWMVIASGNSSLPATSFSPARVNGPYTITVSAITALDEYAAFSHFGFPVKFGAPGVGVLSTWRGNRYRFESGTSMAAPHVAGLRVLGEIESDGYVLNYPTPDPDPIAFRSKK